MAEIISPQVDSSVLAQANQSSTEKEFSVELGITSIQTLLCKMSESVETIVSTQTAISQAIENKDKQWTNRYLRAEREKRSILSLMSSTLERIEEFMVTSYTSITEWMSRYFTQQNGAMMPTYLSDAKYMADFYDEMEERRLKRESELKPDDKNVKSFQGSVLKYLKDIAEKKTSFNIFSNNLSGNKYEKNAVKQKEENEKPKPESKKISFNFRDVIDFSKSLNELSKAMTSKFLDNLERYYDIFVKFTKINPKKLENLSKSMTMFAKNLSVTENAISGIGKGLLFLSAGILSLSVVALLPTTPIAIAYVGLLLWTLKKTVPENEETGKILFDMSKGIAVIAGSLLLLNFVKFSSVFMLAASVLALTYAMNKIKPKEVTGITSLAKAIGILSLSMVVLNYVNWYAPIMMLGFIYGLTKVLSNDRKLLRKGSAEELPKFAMGIGVLTLSVIAMSAVNWTAPLLMLGFIGGLLLLITMSNRLNGKRGSGAALSGLPGFAFGMGLLTLAVVAMSEIDWNGPIKMLVFIGGLLLLITMSNKLNKGGAPGFPSGLPGFAFGVGLLTLAMFAMKELPWDAMWKTLVFIGGLALSLKLMGQTSIWMMPLVAVGVTAIALSMRAVAQSGIEWSHVGMLLATIGGLAVVTGIMGALGPVALIGAATMVLIGGSSLLLAVSLSKISALDISFEDIGKFGASIIGLSLAYLVATPFALLGIVGATLFIPIAVSALLAAGSLAAISALSVDSEKIITFGTSIGELAWAYTKNIGSIIVGLVASALFVPLAITSLLAAGTLKVIGALNVKPDKISGFGSALNILVEAYDDIGFIKAGKVGAKALLLLPMAITSRQIADTLKLLSEVKVGPDQMDVFGRTLATYIQKMADVINSSVSTIKDAQPGIDAIAKLTNIGFQMLDSIHKMANLEIVEHEAKDGQLVVKSVRKFDLEKDAATIQTQMPKILETMTMPIDAMIRDMPRVKKKHQKAAEYIGLIGNSYTPFVDAIVKLAESKIATADTKTLDLFRTNLITATNAVKDGMNTLNGFQLTDVSYEKSVNILKSFIESLTGTETLDEFNEKFSSTIEVLTNEDKWSKAHKNLTQTAKEITDISKAIKTIDVGKATMFNNTIKQLVEANSAADLKACVEALAKLLGMITETQQQMRTVIANQSTAQRTPVVTNNNNSTTTNTETGNANSNAVNDMLNSMITEISEGLASISEKLGRPLKVVPIKTANAL